MMSGTFNPLRKIKLQKLSACLVIFLVLLQSSIGLLTIAPVRAEEVPLEPEAVIEVGTTPAAELNIEEPVELEEEMAEDEAIQEELATEPVTEPVVEIATGEEEEITEEESVEPLSLNLEPQVVTDKSDYAPGEIVKISGENFPPETNLIIRATRPDGSVVKGGVVTDPEGKFEYSYQLNGIEGEYLVEVLEVETVLATTIFTDGIFKTVEVEVIPNLDSCSFPFGGECCGFCECFDCFDCPCPTPTPSDTCGNGIVDHPEEECDDGNNLDGDGCSADCLLELGSISGYKWEDKDADGSRQPGEPGVADWPIFIDQNGDHIFGVEDSVSTHTDSNGNYLLPNLLPGTYSVCESPRIGWQRTYPEASNCHTGIVVGLCEQVTEINFGNFQYSQITACKYNDLNGNGQLDEGELGLAGVDIVLSQGEEELVRQETGENGCTTFNDLDLGAYSVAEDLEDETLAGYSPTSDPEVEIIIESLGQAETVNFFNQPQLLELLLTKENDQTAAVAPGVTVTYTLTVVNNSGMTAFDVSLSDILPYGFTYLADSGLVGGLAGNPSISGQQLTWSLGDLTPEQEKVIVYRATTDTGLETGSYTNMAVAISHNSCLLASVGGCPPGAGLGQRFESEIAQSVVDLIVTLGYGATITSSTVTVLGAATSAPVQVLGAATGSATAWLVLALLLIVAGLLLIDRRKAKSILVALVLLLLMAGWAYGAVQVSITNLSDYLNTYNFKVYYTVLDTSQSPSYSVSGWIRKQGGGWSQFDLAKSDPSGFFQAEPKYFEGEAKYDFKIIGNGVESSIETVTIDFLSPETPRDYRKERISDTAYKIYWRNPQDTDLDRVYVYRSDKREFDANESTVISTEVGAPDGQMSFSDGTLEAHKEYFYALRAIDRAGNASALAGDGGSVTTVVEGVSPADLEGMVAGEEVVFLPGEGEAEEGEILGGISQEVVPGERAGILDQLVDQANRWRWWLGGGALVLIGFGIWFYKRRVK